MYMHIFKCVNITSSSGILHSVCISCSYCLVSFLWQVPFEFVGRKKAIENARLILEYHLDHLKVLVYHFSLAKFVCCMTNI